VTWLILVCISLCICVSLQVHLLVLEFTALKVLLGSPEVGDGFPLLMLKLLLDLVLLGGELLIQRILFVLHHISGWLGSFIYLLLGRYLAFGMLLGWLLRFFIFI